MTNDEDHRIDRRMVADSTTSMVRQILEDAGYDVTAIACPKSEASPCEENPGTRVVEGTASVQFSYGEGYWTDDVEYEIGPVTNSQGGLNWSTLNVTVFAPKRD